jgi:outer membrane receptor protein involved in Fe transport
VFRVVLACLVMLAASAGAHAQPPAGPPEPPRPPQFTQQVDVVAVTPIHGVGLPRLLVPANIQVFTAGQVGELVPLDVGSLLVTRAASVRRSDAQGGTFQPDIVFRGFTASPLLGASEGIAVYQDGVRLNEAFGDTVNWDALPASAVASVNLIPGSNPLFGLNALGGALSIRTKDGFAFPGVRASAGGGAFGRVQVDAEAGGHRGSIGYFAAGSLADESGWRDFSPSTIRRFFGALTARRAASTLNVTATVVSNDLNGNGAAPAGLLAAERSAVFTHPDRTDNDLALLTVTFERQASSTTFLNAVGYFRRSTIGTFNGDAADDEEEGDGNAGEAGDEGAAFDAVNNTSRTRGHAGGLAAQITRTAPLAGRPNHLIAGGSLDAASTRFDFATEWAHLTPERGTVGSGLFDEDAFVDLRSSSLTGSAFVSTTWSVAPAVSLTGSARANWTSIALRDQIGTALTGDHGFRRLNAAAGVTYQIARPLNAYAGYSQSSRVPTPVELTCADPEDPCRLPNAFVSDPPLEQTVAGTWEGGLRGGSTGASWNVSAFSTAVHDDIIFVSSGTLRGEGHFENVERTRRRGLEASAEYTWQDRVSAFATYTWQRAVFDTPLTLASRFHPHAEQAEIHVRPGSRLPGVPAHVAKLGVSASLRAGLSITAAVRGQSSQFLRGDEANLLDPVPAFAVVDAQARQRLTRRLTAVVRVDNLFGARYETFGVLGDPGLLGDEFEDDARFYSPGAPTGAWVGAEVRF